MGFITATKYLPTLPPGWAVRDTPGMDICRVSGHISLEHSAHCCGSRSLADPRKPRVLVLPQYPTTVSLLGTHFYTEGSSVQCGLLFHSRRQKGPRTKGEMCTHWNPGPYFLVLPLPRAHCVTSRSLVPSESRMDISGRVSLGSQVQHRILGRPSFFSPNRSHLAVAGRSQTPLMGSSQPCLSTWFPIA